MRRVRKGFTLIELLVVVVIIGILAATAIPKFVHTKERAFQATMKGDLRNLATAEESYAADNSGSYMPAGTATAASPHNEYSPSTGVTVTIAAPGSNSWSATATHAQGETTCGIFVGSAAPGGSNPATVSGEPKC